VQPTLIIQELQIIKLKQHNINYINQIKFIKLLRDDCHKQAVLISESCGDSNWYTLCRGKPDQHTTRFPCSICVWSSTIHISHDPCIATFRESPTYLYGSHCSWEKRIPTYILSTLADRSMSPHPVSLPLTASEVVGLSQDFVNDKLLSLLGPYTSMLSVRSIFARRG
jgi:hypothetical protein